MTRIIPPSDLIVDQHHRIYHLNLRPDELADTILLVGDPGRVEKVSRHFDSVRVQRQHREIVTHTGTHRGRDISVVSTGMGTDNIDIVINEIDALKNIDFNTNAVLAEPKAVTLIRLGTCGALQADIDIHDYVVGNYGLGLDNVMQYYHWQPDAQAAAIQTALQEQLALEHISPYLTRADAALVAQFQAQGAHAGITATCSGFYGPQARHLRLAPKYPQLLTQLSQFRHDAHRVANFEMETSAIYGLGALLGHRCCALNLVVANRITEAFSPGYAKAMDEFIEWALVNIA